MSLKKIFRMRVVSDTSPISCLASIQRLDLLERQFNSVYVPPAVKLEVMRHPDPRATVALQQAFERGLIIEDESTDLGLGLAPLRRTLDQGESEAINLAVNLGAGLLLMDERDGREIARDFGLNLTGTLGILMKAKIDGSLVSLGDAIQELQIRYAFSLASDLVERALQEVGEG